MKREPEASAVRQDLVAPELRPACPACGCRAVSLVDETTASFYFVCVQCDRTWQEPRLLPHN